MDRGAWRAIVHGVAKSWTLLNDYYFLSLNSHSLKVMGLRFRLWRV